MDLWSIGGRDLLDDINSNTTIVLTLCSSNSNAVYPILVELGRRIGKPVNRYKWVWLYNYISKYLQLRCIKRVRRSGGRKRYDYHIDMSTWSSNRSA